MSRCLLTDLLQNKQLEIITLVLSYQSHISLLAQSLTVEIFFTGDCTVGAVISLVSEEIQKRCVLVLFLAPVS